MLKSTTLIALAGLFAITGAAPLAAHTGTEAASAGDWHFSLKTAAQALENSPDKQLLLVFSDTEDCPPCIRFEREILGREAFTKYAANRLVLLKLPCELRTGEAVDPDHEALRQLLAVEAFPTWWLLDSDYLPLLQGGYVRGGPNALRRLLEDTQRNEEMLPLAQIIQQRFVR